jgi:lipopolysaccharide biosynthesis glycosyltransferase
MIKVFIGYDPRQAVSYNVCQHSILIRTTRPVAIIPLVIETLPIKRVGLTPFTWTRFLVPYLSKYEGISIFLDADIILQHDISELVDRVNKLSINGSIPAVSVVKSMQKFEWASMMVFNCEHPDNRKLTPEYIEKTNDKLHMISWTECVGEISAEWNHLVGYDKPWDGNNDKKVNLIHYTQGVPAWHETSDCEFSEEWRKELSYINSAIKWVDLMGKSVHAKILSDESIVPKYKALEMEDKLKFKGDL